MKEILWGGLLLFLIGACSRPVAQFSMHNPAPARTAPADVQFVNTSQNADRYEWDFGDGATSTEANPVHHYVESGDYTVTMRAFKGDRVRTARQQVTILPPEDCLVEIQTPYGNMLVELSDQTPLHQDNFLKLAETGFYDSLLFHRVIKGFMIQGGDPYSRSQAGRVGTGGPGYTIPAEFNTDLLHFKGAVAAARTNNPQKRSSGSQFYIVQGKPVTDAMLDRIEQMRGFSYSPAQRKRYKEMGGTPQLDMEYTVFGYVVKGLDVIDRIAGVRTNRYDRPVEDVWMVVKVVR